MKEKDRESRRHLVSLKSDDKICPQCGGRKKFEDDVCQECEDAAYVKLFKLLTKQDK